MGFLAVIVVAVITGYLLPWSQGNPLDVYGVAIPSPIASSRGFHEFMEEVHDVSGRCCQLNEGRSQLNV